MSLLHHKGFFVANRLWLLLVPLLLISLACGFLSGQPTAAVLTPVAVVPSASPTPSPSLAATTAIPTPSAVPASATPAESPTARPTQTNTPVPTPLLSDLSLAVRDVLVYPAPAVYAGEPVSFQVMPYLPNGLAPDAVTVQLLVDGNQVASGNLNWRTLGGDVGSLFPWAWNTTGQAGPHMVSVLLDPGNLVYVGDENPNNNRVDFTLTIEAPEARPPAEVEATWLTADNNCCTVHVISNTTAHRDLEQLLALVDGAFQEASARLAEPAAQRYQVYLVDRVIGQGGYAAGSMVISYLDRDYAGGGLYEVLVHEAVHLLDHQFAPNRVVFLAEGVAVWATGGHYKQENVDQRTAALVESGLYIPLEQLIDNFYPAQHEISYLEAAGFVSFLVNTYGWERVRPFYVDVTASDAPTLHQAVDINLQIHFNKTLAQVEAEWMVYLAGLPRDRMAITDLRTTIHFYDVVRRYQNVYDPAAYYLRAWLPPAEELEQRGLTAEFTRHPESVRHITLETMLQAADAALNAGDYNRATVLLDSVSRVIDNNGAFLDPLANNYLAIVQTATNLGYEVQQVELVGDEATVAVLRPGQANLFQLRLVLDNQAWILAR
ncbi:MAG: hypothetical protein L0332_10845 [Chloroflexi bacterium]|nr:hypothetical protein [Chloroflexota bacterium]MCI0575455.1 hypothetical protein [Chloroflexota bacterium]MCI0645403.1 hypothetical protein [Chloroflexota bacterium]MCI0727204.1 hypothetical protein [Chloroflexota bacterium]